VPAARRQQHGKSHDIGPAATCQPSVSRRPVFFASGTLLVIATPADDPNQMIGPPEPTAWAGTPQS